MPVPLLSATVTGTGPRTLVLLHGVFMDRTIWDAVDVDGVRTVRVDMPSHGASPDLAPGANLDDHVVAVADTLDSLGVAAAVVAGHSWGGMVAVRLARRRPDLVAGVVLANTPLLRTRGVSRVGFATQRALLTLGLPAGMYGRMAARALIGERHRRAHPEQADAMAARTAAMGRRRVAETLRSVLLEPEDALDAATALPVPWAAVAGEQDYVLAGGVAEALGPNLTVVPGAHTSPLEAPQAMSTAVRTVLDAVSSPTR